MKYKDAQNYILTAYQWKLLVEEAIFQSLEKKLVHTHIWTNNLFNAHQIIEGDLKRMWQLQKEIRENQTPENIVYLIYLCTLNIYSIIPLVMENYEKAILDFNPFDGTIFKSSFLKSNEVNTGFHEQS